MLFVFALIVIMQPGNQRFTTPLGAVTIGSAQSVRDSIEFPSVLPAVTSRVMRKSRNS